MHLQPDYFQAHIIRMEAAPPSRSRSKHFFLNKHIKKLKYPGVGALCLGVKIDVN